MTKKQWVGGITLELMMAASVKISRVSKAPVVGGVFKAGDEVLLSPEDQPGEVFVLVEEEISGVVGLRVARKSRPDDRLWSRWDDVVAWRRPDA